MAGGFVGLAVFSGVIFFLAVRMCATHDDVFCYDMILSLSPTVLLSIYCRREADQEDKAEDFPGHSQAGDWLV